MRLYLIIFLALVSYQLKCQIRNPSDSITIKVQGSLKYPQLARKVGIQGVVKIKLAFDDKCNLIKKEIIKSLGYGCDESALNLLKDVEEQIQKQKGGKCGKNYEWIIPIYFKLDE